MIATEVRCDWCLKDTLYIDYHDREWGVPVRDDQRIFEFIVLESAQAGLSWLTILRKREAYRRAFAGFAVDLVAAFGDTDQERLLLDAGIVRNLAKIRAAINNARAAQKIAARFGSLAEFFWRFTDGRQICNHWQNIAQVPAKTALAETIASELKAFGFAFFGPVITYSHMQATGMVNDHLVGCFRYKELCDLARRSK